MNQDGFTKIHFLIAAVFALTLTLGSFAGVTALTQMSDKSMSEITGQEGILMDIHLGSSFTATALWTDGDGAGNTTGTVGIHGIQPAGGSALDLTGLTINADGATTVGATNGGAIVVGLPNIPNGILVNDIDPGNATAATSNTTFSSTAGNSIGSFAVGGINAGNSTIEVAAD